MSELAIINAGMVNSVGLNAAASCAAIRCALTGFAETRYMFAGEWILGSEVSIEEPLTGKAKLLHMVSAAIKECLDASGAVQIAKTPLLLCLAEQNRPGRIADLDETFFHEIQNQFGERFHHDSAIFPHGRMGGVLAIKYAKQLVENGHSDCIVAGVDSLLNGATLKAYNQRRWILTAENSDGFIPGEAAAAVHLAKPLNNSDLTITGIGYGTEAASLDSELPLRGQGLSDAFKMAMSDSSMGFEKVHYRICDANGIQYSFKEAALALARSVRPVKKAFDVWHPADCIGEVGAAIVPTVLACALSAHRKRYAPGPGVLCHFSSEETERAALILSPGVQR